MEEVVSAHAPHRPIFWGRQKYSKRVWARSLSNNLETILTGFPTHKAKHQKDQLLKCNFFSSCIIIIIYCWKFEYLNTTTDWQLLSHLHLLCCPNQIRLQLRDDKVTVSIQERCRELCPENVLGQVSSWGQSSTWWPACRAESSSDSFLIWKTEWLFSILSKACPSTIELLIFAGQLLTE